MKIFCLLFVLTFPLFADKVQVPKGIDHLDYQRLLKTYVNAQGLVDYRSWKASDEDMQALNLYLRQFASSEAPASGNEEIASLLNAYNAFTLKLILDHYPTESIRELDKPFKTKRNLIAGRKVSLDEIEHDTLRPLITWKVHALVVCAARSCPPLASDAYQPQSWETQMQDRYRVWLAREDLNRFVPENKKVYISKIFSWYRKDFKHAHSVQNILKNFGPKSITPLLEKGNYRIRYQPYHWGLNDQSELGTTYKHSFF